MAQSKPQQTIRRRKEKDEYPPIDPADAANITVSIATIVNNAIHHYWFSEADATSATKEAYALLARVMKTCSPIAVRVIGDELTVNGVAVPDTKLNVAVLIHHLNDLEIDNFDLQEGITEDGFVKLVELFCVQPAELQRLGGFSAVLSDFDVDHVIHRKVVITQIEEGEVVVGEGELGDGDGGPSSETVGNILAFLKGDIASDSPMPTDEINEVASDAAKMAELIMQAAEVRKQSAQVEEGETLVDFVVGCLKRTFDALKDDRSYRSKIGKKRLKKNLLLLEEEVLNRMREMSEEWKNEDLQAIHDATEDMTEEMQIDSLADDYVARQAQTEAVEKQVIDYIRAHNITDFSDNRLKAVFSERGLDAGDWQKLVIKSGNADATAIGLGAGAGPGHGTGESPGKGAGPGSAGAGMGPGMGAGLGGGLGSVFEAIGQLETLLDHMEKQFEGADEGMQDGNCRKLVSTLKDVHGQIDGLTTKTEKSLRALAETVHADAREVSEAEVTARNAGHTIMLTREKMLGILGKAVTEMAEPLEFIRSSTDVLRSKTLGGVNSAQREVLDMVMENTRAIQALLEELACLAGPK